MARQRNVREKFMDTKSKLRGIKVSLVIKQCLPVNVTPLSHSV